jgi:tetratricopeptide (TPR) repeat protein
MIWSRADRRGVATCARPGGTAGGGVPRQGGAARLFTWRRALSGGGIAFLFLGLSAGGYLGMRAAGIGPAATLLSRGDLSDEDRLVLADFGATGTDTLLAVAITDALRIDLEQSRAVSLASTSFLQGAQQRMGRPHGARLLEADALQLALREGLKAVITGDIARVGGAFTVNARVLRASDGEPLISVREQARSEAELLDAVDRLSRRVRERIGESLRTVRASEPLAQVTTGSIEALQLYSQAARLHLNGSSDDTERAVHLAEQAIAIDPGFAMAYRLLGIISSNAVFDRGRALDMLTRAYELGERLTERERLATTAAYHRETGDSDRAVATYEQLLSRFPDDLIALNNVAIIYSEQGDMARAAESYARVVAADSTRRLSHRNLVYELAASGRVDEAQAALQVARRRFPDDAMLDRVQASVHMADGDLAGARRSAEAFVAAERAPLARAIGIGNLAVIDALSGRPARALTHHRGMTGLLEQAGARAGALAVKSRFSLVRIENWGEPAGRVVAELDEYLGRHELDTMPVAERPYVMLAVAYAAAGQGAARGTCGTASSATSSQRQGCAVTRSTCRRWTDNCSSTKGAQRRVRACCGVRASACAAAAAWYRRSPGHSTRPPCPTPHWRTTTCTWTLPWPRGRWTCSGGRAPCCALPNCTRQQATWTAPACTTAGSWSCGRTPSRPCVRAWRRSARASHG